MSRQEALAQSRYRHPSRASLKAETARNARRDRHRKATLTVGTLSAAAAGLVTAYRMVRGPAR
ncbi:hypothetical protein GCM10009838_62770 [Catenulispora subtropica]|uniref:Uncharacterized protein n=2 Tax=Catenulispora subtropica TaxID=450798 RepID=A0ABP5E4F0_9ACTN